MQNSGNSAVKLVITVLAVLCLILAIVFFVKNKPDCSGGSSPEPVPDSEYSYQDDFSVSDGDITFDDNSTEEMDTIPNDESAPPASSTDS